MKGDSPAIPVPRALIGFSVTIFLGAFLLFQVQPLIARYILPWFGGTQSVWTTCLLFFQVLLLGGYAYAHWITRLGSIRMQAGLHTLLVFAAIYFLPPSPGENWKPEPETEPTLHILRLLVATIGLPYLVLSATGPLIQSWYSRRHASGTPYRLYSLSNIGSMLALVSFPFAFEPLFSRGDLAKYWGWGFLAYTVCCGYCAWQMWRLEDDPASGAQQNQAASQAASQTPMMRQKLLWFGFPLCASVILLATTNTITQDVAAIPFLWVLPLSLYLLTFVICFDNPAWYRRRLFGWLLVPALGLVCVMTNRAYGQSIFTQIGVYAGTLFISGMVCHGEVYRLRPASKHLTAYYLMIAAGGAAGGVLVAVVAPLVFDTYAELGWGLVVMCLLLVGLHAGEKTSWKIGARAMPLWPILAGGALVLTGWLSFEASVGMRNVVVRTRNFYGTVSVVEAAKGDSKLHNFQMFHGSIGHGIQFQDPAILDIPTTYFHNQSGVGLALANFRRDTARRIGVVGLGVGTLCAYAQPGDVFRFYELHPDVERLARSHFSYLERCKGKVEVVLGDGRLSLEREPSQQFDILVLDAFSGDSVPVHLLTREAFNTYLRHLKPEGVIAVNIVNKHLDLFPVLVGAAAQFNLKLAHLAWDEKGWPIWMTKTRWALLDRNSGLLDTPRIRAAAHASPAPYEMRLDWTDDYVSLWRVLMMPW